MKHGVAPVGVVGDLGRVGAFDPQLLDALLFPVLWQGYPDFDALGIGGQVSDGGLVSDR